MYDQHYGLTGRPFQLTPDPRFWFDTATHKKAMAYLGYGLNQGEGFIVITGDIGAGKTTLVGHLVDTVDASRLNVIRIVSTQIAPDDLLRTVCAGLEVDPTGMTKAQMLGGIERGLHVVARGGRRTLLVVDEAQALPVDSLEELRMLSNFQAGGHALLQIFLLGQPEFREKLADDALEQLRQRVIAMHHLGPMEPDELAPYLIHRLGVVGWQGRPDFSADALSAIYAWSGGIPRRINQLVSRVMLHGAIEGIDSFSASDVGAVVGDLGGDGMTGGDIAIASHDGEPQLDFDAAPIAVAADAEDVPVPVVPIVADAPIEDPVVMEWPFRHLAEAEDGPVIEATAESATDDAEPDAGWQPIVADAPSADAETDAPAIVLEPPVPVVEAIEPEPEHVDELEPEPPTEQQEAPVAISAPPRLFERFSLRNRKPVLVAVDPAAAAEEPAATEAQPEPAPAQPVADADLARRLSEIEQRLEDQDAALRRVLTLLVDWVEGGARGDVTGFREKLG